MNTRVPGPASRHVGAPVAHESASAHVTGEARYTDDLLARFPGVLHAWPVMAPHAHAHVRTLDVSAAAASPGVVRVLTADDVPGEGDTGPTRHDARIRWAAHITAIIPPYQARRIVRSA